MKGESSLQGPAYGSLASILAASPSLADLKGSLERAAASDAALLIVGEPGCGRTVLARSLHAASGRADGPLVEVDPGVIPSTLFESELFGHAAGAFTGAERSSIGRVERARGGSLLLDPLEELPLPVQPKLLRLLAERRYTPLGGQEREANVRFLAVATQELPERVRQGAFRSDLYYRLEVLAFRLPPLRERREDLPLLIEAMLVDLAARYDRSPLQLAPAAWAWMEEYSWPGNLRELRNVLEREVVVSDTHVLEPRPPRRVAQERPQSLLDVERAAIETALAYARGHQTRAAEILGISRKALWQKRKRLGIP